MSATVGRRYKSAGEWGRAPTAEHGGTWLPAKSGGKPPHSKGKRDARSSSHRQDDAELGVAAEHAGVSLGRFFERISFDHRAHAG
jgi:hypothetical protein